VLFSYSWIRWIPTKERPVSIAKAHARRKFYDLHQATGSPIAAEALRRIAELYVNRRGVPTPIGELSY
jgi:Transposase IS66 family